MAGKLTQTQVVAKLAESCDLNKKVVKFMLDELAVLAVNETKENGVFIIPGIGRLVKSDRQERMGRNPATGESIRIPARKVVKFRLAKSCKDAIVP